jgi:hypothetical protein
MENSLRGKRRLAVSTRETVMGSWRERHARARPTAIQYDETNPRAGDFHRPANRIMALSPAKGKATLPQVGRLTAQIGSLALTNSRGAVAPVAARSPSSLERRPHSRRYARPASSSRSIRCESRLPCGASIVERHSLGLRKG